MKTSKSHSGIFWATCYDFINKAIELKSYTRKRSEQTAALVAEAVEIQRKIIEVQKELGRIITKLYDSCQNNGERIEDGIEHDLQLSRNKARELMKNNISDSEDNEELKAVNVTKEPMVRHAAPAAADSRKTVEQGRAIAKQKAKAIGFETPEPQSLFDARKMAKKEHRTV